jgi:hypothetical protein
MEIKYVRHVMDEDVLVKDLKVLKLKNAMHAMGIKFAQGAVEKGKFEVTFTISRCLFYMLYRYFVKSNSLPHILYY